MALLAALNPYKDKNVLPYEFGGFSPKKLSLRQDVGRVDIVDEDKNVVQVHAIRLYPSSILGIILKTAVLGRFLTRILYGSYSYHSIFGDDVLVSDISLKKSMIELKKLRDLAEERKFQFGLYTQSKERFGLGIGRFAVSTVEGSLNDVHAIKLKKDAFLSSWISPSFFGGVITKAIFGDYRYKTIGGENFLVSERSLKASVLQQKAIQQLDEFTKSDKYTGKLAAKVDEVRKQLVQDKSPFRSLVSGVAKAYHDLNKFALYVHGAALEIFVSLKPLGEGGTKEASLAFNITKMKEQVLVGFKEIPLIIRLLQVYLFGVSAQNEYTIYKELKDRGLKRIVGMDHFTPDTAGNTVAYMELCKGGELKDAFKDMTIEQKVHCLVQVSETLAQMHENGYVHRDVRVDNVFMHEGVPQLADFGLALPIGSLTLPHGPHEENGPPEGYIPPDLQNSDFPLHRATPTQDLWCLGLMIRRVFASDLDHYPILNALVTLLMCEKPEDRMSARGASTILEAELKRISRLNG